MDILRERSSTSLAMEGGVLHLLRFARAECHAAVAFAALVRDDGVIDVVAVPPLSDGSEWTLEALQAIARQTLDDPVVGQGRVVIQVSEIFRRYWPGERQQTRMAVALLRDVDSSQPCGLLCALDPVAGQFSDSNLDMLGRLGVRLVNHLRARRRLMKDLLDQGSGGVIDFAQLPPPPPSPPDDVVSDPAGGFASRLDNDFSLLASGALEGFFPEGDTEDVSSVLLGDDASSGTGLAVDGHGAPQPPPSSEDTVLLHGGSAPDALGLSQLVDQLDVALGRFAARGRPGALLVVEVREPNTAGPAGHEEIEAAVDRLSRASRSDDVILPVGEAMLAAILALRPGSRDLSELRERLATAVGGEPLRPQLSISSAIVRIDPDEEQTPEELLFSAVRELGDDDAGDDPEEDLPPDGGPFPLSDMNGGGSGSAEPQPSGGEGPGTAPGREGDPSGAPTALGESSVAQAATGAAPGLGRLAARGAAYLTAREAIGAVVRLAGTVVVMRFIGPASYGVYAGAAAFVLFITLSAQMGAEVYLIRQPEDPSPQVYGSVLTFLVLSSLVLSAAGIAVTFLIPGTLHPRGVLLPLRILMASVPINVCWAPFQAKIERDFGYRRLGFLELAGDAVLYGTAVPLAICGFGPWSLVAGCFAWQGFLLVGAVALSGITPRLAWSPATMRSLLRHGLSYASTSWVIALANLANPLVVGRYAGAAGVGYVSFAQRLVATVGFAARSAYRLGIVALSKIKETERPRLRRAVEVGSMLQLVALAVPLGTFALVARLAVPRMFGAEWDKAIPLFSLLALAAVMNASGLIQTSVLLSRGQNLRVTAAAVVQSIVFVGVLATAVPRVGIIGYGLATVAALVGLAFIDAMARREVSFGYRHLIPLAVGLVPPVLAPLVPLRYGLLTLLPLAVVLVLPAPRRELGEAARLGRSLVLRTAP